MTAGRNDEILTRWNLEKILTNRVRGIDSNPILDFTQRVSLFLEQHQLKIDGDIWELLWQDEVFTTEKELQVFEVMIPIKHVSH